MEWIKKIINTVLVESKRKALNYIDIYRTDTKHKISILYHARIGLQKYLAQVNEDIAIGYKQQ